MGRYRHVIWDWNGTLLDDLDIVVSVMNDVLARRSLAPLTHERYREVFDFPVRKYYEAVGLDLSAEPFESLAAEWISGFQGRWSEGRLHAHAQRVLGVVDSFGVSQSVLSAAEQGLLREQARHFKVDGWFARLVGIDDHHAESKLERGREWIAELGHAPGDVLLVGDTTHDAEVGAALGVDVVLVDDGHQSRSRLEACGVPVLGSLGELVRQGGLLSSSAGTTSPGWRDSRGGAGSP